MKKFKPRAISLQVSFIKQGKVFIAYSPALDLSTCGKTLKEAEKRFLEIVSLFIEETVENESLGKVLSDLGWQKLKTKWKAPEVIKQESLDFKIPLAA